MWRTLGASFQLLLVLLGKPWKLPGAAAQVRSFHGRSRGRCSDRGAFNRFSLLLTTLATGAHLVAKCSIFFRLSQSYDFHPARASSIKLEQASEPRFNMPTPSKRAISSCFPLRQSTSLFFPPRLVTAIRLFSRKLRSSRQGNRERLLNDASQHIPAIALRRRKEEGQRNWCLPGCAIILPRAISLLGSGSLPLTPRLRLGGDPSPPFEYSTSSTKILLRAARRQSSHRRRLNQAQPGPTVSQTANQSSQPWFICHARSIMVSPRDRITQLRRHLLLKLCTDEPSH
ncbi:hypothetical protein BD289DRAFT_129462 [Coniella lustricola]|uniref:Secreted protein n=1 Tax=Coniella lustricola TaxID=2025994 RepID=A0A2T2ZW34_9PEZI|nr:hypothetical protein BD289DRAFT_129462 [Coniella lustricola]